MFGLQYEEVGGAGLDGSMGVATSGDSSRAAPEPASSDTGLAGSGPERPVGSRLDGTIEMIGGGTALAGGLVLLLLAPGYWPVGRNPAPVLAGIDLFLGVLAILHGTLRATGRLLARGRFGRRNARVVLAGGAVILAAMCVASVGGLPGVYYGSPGSVRFELGGCGAPGTVGPPALPDSFPLGSHVRLYWASVNLQNTSFRIVQDHPNRLGMAWRAQEDGTAGSFDFIGSGGPVWMYAVVLSAPCPDVGSVQVTWTYSTEI